ncbi:MAG TPA: primosomal protein N' [Gemmatimonadales bacterium]|nr:primosomal protein N' [Gemmatimonadales bacterium]
MSDSAARTAGIVLPLPLSRLYHYRIPDHLAPRVVPGARVVVPVRNRSVIGVVVATSTSPAPRELKDIAEAPDAEPALSPALLRLGHWIGNYYGAPAGLAFRALLPGALWRASTPSGPAVKAERVLRIVRELPSLLEREQVFRRSPKRRMAFETIEALGGSAPIRHLRERLKISTAVLEGLVAQQLAAIDVVATPRDPFATLSSPPPPSLTPDQVRVLREIESTAPAAPVLIQGVTGSGKTLVYLHLMKHVVDQGGGAILLVPEIALTPQTVARVRGVFGDQVAVLHSGLSEGERADAWRAVRAGERRVVVGARSAVFAPVRHLGVIVVDEEHEASYKQGNAPRYHARDVARVRAQLEHARLVLGSATPSLETLFQGSHGRIHVFRLPRRVGTRPLPRVEVVDLRSAPREPHAGALPWSEVLDAAVRRALDEGDQIILLLNRRGFATYLQCPACGDVRECPRCAISLTVHHAPASLRCHYCGHEEPIPVTCRLCGHDVQRMRGIGTQQLEQFVAGRFPGARLARMDLDTTSTKWAHHRILERFAAREVDILLGTQMIAKGLDFPGVTLVGVIDADTALHLPDFRAGERTFQLVAQVAGRAGRGAKGGTVVVQTRAPDHHAIIAVKAGAGEGDGGGDSLERFAARELELRAPPHPAYPPHVFLARILVTAPQEARAAQLASRVASWLRACIGDKREVQVLGPAPCPIPRLQGQWRWHALLRAADGRSIGQVVRAWTRSPMAREFQGAVVVDRDPVALL